MAQPMDRPLRTSRMESAMNLRRKTHRRADQLQMTRSSSCSIQREQQAIDNYNRNFPCINVRGVCIKCGDGWMVGSWQRRPRFILLPTNCPDKDFDNLTGKKLCDGCHKAHPLAPHMFSVWQPEVTDETVRLVHQKLEPTYIDPAKSAATYFALC